MGDPAALGEAKRLVEKFLPCCTGDKSPGISRLQSVKESGCQSHTQAFVVGRESGRWVGGQPWLY